MEPGPGQESCWDYPRPPKLERSDAHLVGMLNGKVSEHCYDMLLPEPTPIANNLQKLFDTKAAWAVKETSHPPTFYIPAGDIDMEQLQPSGARSTFCEWKGRQVVAACLCQPASISQPVQLPSHACDSLLRQASQVCVSPQAPGCWRAVLRVCQVLQGCVEFLLCPVEEHIR